MEYRNIEQTVNIPLFKYFGNVDYAIDSIKNSRIHLEMPASYNDIYDSVYNVFPDDLKHMFFGDFFKIDVLKKYFDFLDNDEMEDIISRRMTIGEIIDYLCDKNKEINKDDFIQSTIDYFTNGRKMLQASNNKISCFSEVNDSLLMWAYYANNHTGVCIRYNAPQDKMLSKYCRKVQYTNHYISDLGFGVYFRKSLQWSHEQEWRIVCDTEEEYLPIDSIDAIYLGVRIDKNNIKKFFDLGKRYCLEVYRMFPSYKKYEIRPNKIL